MLFRQVFWRYGLSEQRDPEPERKQLIMMTPSPWNPLGDSTRNTWLREVFDIVQSCIDNWSSSWSHSNEGHTPLVSAITSEGSSGLLHVRGVYKPQILFMAVCMLPLRPPTTADHLWSSCDSMKQQLSLLTIIIKFFCVFSGST